jgi:hypothetical protein
MTATCICNRAAVKPRGRAEPRLAIWTLDRTCGYHARVIEALKELRGKRGQPDVQELQVSEELLTILMKKNAEEHTKGPPSQ